MQTQTATATHQPAPIADKDAIIGLLGKWIAQRPGLDARNYDAAGYRSDSRSITRDRDDARTLLQYVAARDSITADMLREGFRAYSGRLSLGTDARGRMCLDYCTGQYWPTEYRRAAATVLASVIWDWLRDCCMPAPDGYRVCAWTAQGGAKSRIHARREVADILLADAGGQQYGHVQECYVGLCAGDFIRRAARKELGSKIAKRFFNAGYIA